MDVVWKRRFLIVGTFVLQSVSLHYSAEPSALTLWGKKVNFMLHKCRYLQLRDDLWIPKLDELTVCLDLWTQILTQDWTIFVYKKRGGVHPQLGLAGEGDNLRVWLLEVSWLSSKKLSLRSWHSICLTWSGLERRLGLYINGTRVDLKEEMRIRPGPLSPNGTLTLGLSHGFTNGDLIPESGHSLPGCVSLFRMWPREHTSQQLQDLRCATGNLVRWTASDWQMDSCQAIPDASLECGERVASARRPSRSGCHTASFARLPLSQWNCVDRFGLIC
ncbi:putative G-protein coupled receptor 112 [Arapaima gigas]